MAGYRVWVGIVWLMMAGVAGPSDGFAQEDRVRRPVTAHVTAFMTGEAGDALTQDVLDRVREALHLQGVETSDKPEMTLFVAVREVERGDENDLVLSVVTLHGLPEPLVEKGKQDEAFYLTFPEDKRAALPDEGTWVRQYVSEEYLRQFMMVQAHDVRVVKASALDQAVAEIADTFVDRYGYYAEPRQ